MPESFQQKLADFTVPEPQRLALCRFVPEGDLDRYLPRDYLFTSGSPGRYNPKGVKAFYSSQDATIAGVELDRRLAQLPFGRPRPRQVLYSVEASLPILDLGDTTILRQLNLTPEDLLAEWEFVSAPSLMQRLGQAISHQARFGAIRVPSEAARERGITGFNFVFFPSAIITPMVVMIRDDQGNDIQRWPAA